MTTNTNISPPPLLKKKGVPPSLDNINNNLTKPMEGELVAFNFRVPVEFRKQVRQYALDHDTTAVQLVVTALEKHMSKK